MTLNSIISSARENGNIALRSLKLKQEFLLTMIKIRTGILLQDLAFHFQIFLGLVSNIFTTWVKFLSKELEWIITWPNRNIIKRNLPTIFREYYPKCCVIIDCPELFIEKPSSLDATAIVGQITRTITLLSTLFVLLQMEIFHFF